VLQKRRRKGGKLIWQGMHKECTKEQTWGTTAKSFCLNGIMTEDKKKEVSIKMITPNYLPMLLKMATSSIA
jgi:hypothetical protein